MIRALLLLALGFHASVVLASECTMRARPIDVQRIVRAAEVKAAVHTADRFSASVLLRDGQMMRVSSSGCDKSGMKLTVWMADGQERLAHDDWLRLGERFVRLAFPADVASDFEKTYRAGKIMVVPTAGTLFRALAQVSEFMSFEVVVTPGEDGVFLSVSYVLG